MMDFVQAFLQDEFLSKAFILGAVMGTITAVLMYSKQLPMVIWARIRRLIVYTVTIEQTDELFDYVERWFRDNHSKKYRNVLAHISYNNFAIIFPGCSIQLCFQHFNIVIV